MVSWLIRRLRLIRVVLSAVRIVDRLDSIDAVDAAFADPANAAECVNCAEALAAWPAVRTAVLRNIADAEDRARARAARWGLVREFEAALEHAE